MNSESIPLNPRRTLSHQSSGKIMLLVAFLCFITLGMHDGLLGVAWPSMRETFGVTLDSLGIILMASTAGFFLSSFNNGWLASVFEIGALLLVANLFRVVGLLGYALFPHWLGIVFSALLVGLGAGTIDSGMNTYVAANYGSGRLNWLHACYAVGATLTPLIVTALLVAGQSWRWGYVVIATVQLGLVFYFALTMKQWKSRSILNGAGRVSQPRAKSSDTLRLVVVWLAISVFLISTGIELAVGQWSFTLFTQGRGVPVSMAGLWVSIYWGCFAVGRFLFGFLADHVNPTWLLRVSLTGMVVGTALIWWNPSNWVGFGGLAIMGFWMAPLLPVLVGVTPKRFGAQHATNAIGFEVAATNLGAALVPAVTGVLAANLGLGIIAPFLLIAAVLTFAQHEILVRKCGV